MLASCVRPKLLIPFMSIYAFVLRRLCKKQCDDASLYLDHSHWARDCPNAITVKGNIFLCLHEIVSSPDLGIYSCGGLERKLIHCICLTHLSSQNKK